MEWIMSPAFSLIWRTLQETFTCGQKAVKEEFAAPLLCMLQTFIHEKTTKVLVYVMIFYLKKKKLFCYQICQKPHVKNSPFLEMVNTHTRHST